MALALQIVLFASVDAQTEPADTLVPLIVDLLRESDADIRSLAFEQVRTSAPGAAATRQFAAELPKLPAEAQVGLLSALADRGDPAARPNVVEALGSQSESVRIAALRALSFLGEPSDVPQMLRFLSSGAPEERLAARASLVRLPGDATSKSITEQLNRVDAPLRIALIEVLVARRAQQSSTALSPFAVDSDRSTRKAAMAALGQLGSADQIPAMVNGVLTAESGAERAAAEKAVMFVCSRDGRAAERLLKEVDQLQADEQLLMLSTIGRVGGNGALARIESAIAHRNSAQHSAGVRAISNWPDASIAPRLTELATTDKHPNHRITMLRALIRVAPLPDARTDAERLALLQQAFGMCQRNTERNLVLDRAQAVRTPETLRFLVPFLDQPQLAQQACQSIVELAHHRWLRDQYKSEFHAALDKVIQISQDATVVDRAGRYQRGQTWVRPK